MFAYSVWRMKSLFLTIAIVGSGWNWGSKDDALFVSLILYGPKVVSIQPFPYICPQIALLPMASKSQIHKSSSVLLFGVSDLPLSTFPNVRQEPQTQSSEIEFVILPSDALSSNPPPQWGVPSSIKAPCRKPKSSKFLSLIWSGLESWPFYLPSVFWIG